MADLTLSGLASGFDWKTLVEQFVDLERTSQRRMFSEQNAIQIRNNAYSSLVTQMGALQNKVTALQSPDLFGARTASTSDAEMATVIADASTPRGSYAIDVTQLATSTVRQGTPNVGNAFSATSDVGGITVGTAPLRTAITAGTFSVNGHQVSIATTDSLTSVFQKINSATGGDVTASYDPTSDKIRLTSASSGEIILGTAADTSNFLQATKLSNNGTPSIASSSALGTAQMSANLDAANLGTTISPGSFRINGVAFDFVATDSLQSVLDRINSSQAGVTATFDPANDQFRLINKSTGDVGMALEDVTGNFLAGTGLLGGSTQRGKDLIYSINGGGQAISHSNTIEGESSGVEGLKVNVLQEGKVTVKIGTDVDKIKTAISSFIDDFNRMQSLIDSSVSSTTDAAGKVTAGTLAGESDANSIGSRLRSLANSTVSSLSGALNRLDKIGISSNGNDNTIKISNTSALDDAIENHLDSLASLFTAEETGIASRLNSFITGTIGENGTLIEHQDVLKTQVTNIDQQITSQERLVEAYRSRLVASFVSMETAQARTNQQLAFLLKTFAS